MMARLVHIPYQLCQPEMLPSITSGCRAVEMPAMATLEMEASRMGHGNGTLGDAAEFPVDQRFFPAAARRPQQRAWQAEPAMDTL
jgi:hypothetical protein